MATLHLPYLDKATGPMGRIRSWTGLARPRRALSFGLALTLLYCLVVSWRSARHIAAALRTADVVRDSRGIGVMLRLGSVDIQGLGENDVDEARLPFDDINVTSRKSDDAIRREFDEEYDEAGR